MKTNWLTSVSLALSLTFGTMISAVHADNKGGMKFSQSSSGRVMQSSNGNNVSRSMGVSNGLGVSSSQGMNTQIKTINGIGTGVGLAGRTHSPTLGKVQGISGAILTKPNYDSAAAKGINGAILNKPILNGDSIKKIGDAVKKPQINLKPDLINKINPAILNGKKIDPGFNKCLPNSNFCKIGCLPWWWVPHWGTHCTYYPSYTHYCPQPIVIPVVTTVSVVEEQLLQIPVGSTVMLQALGLGDEVGQVVASMDKISFPSKINEWKSDSVNATLPLVGLSAPVRGEILLLRADGSLARNVKVEFLPAPQPTDSTIMTSTTVVQ